MNAHADDSILMFRLKSLLVLCDFQLKRIERVYELSS